MSLSSDDHVTLLLSCINHSSNGKIDFGAVAKECNIISAGAAAKRFSRLTKAHKEAMNKGGNVDNDAHGVNEDESSAKDPEQAGASLAKGKRKGKAAGTTKGDGAAPAKKRARAAKNKVVVKEESQGDYDEEEKDANANGNDNDNAKVKDEDEDFDIMGTVSDLSEDLDEIDTDESYC
ncbi:uncharacterized protein APUU_11762S [Aspergillus puulaauensis]|uniref:Myb-like DNA-binding domain-containing protein n=1 Tax=Aspergillus puulaauensis TaxID=1220207 RepID=A0A7R7XCR1_9EURO|nr:uncharacterized protein APUU_11762S [Aspergillus puulaauensis]BCS18934.1 hypothetical protein APUU_11762S [Aspergillus puulaauensis]